MRLQYLTLTATITAALFLAASTSVFAQSASGSQSAATEESERIDDSVEVLRALVESPDDAIPQYLLQRAEAIVIIPSLVRGGFVLGAKHGRGVLSVRNAAANIWTPPAFVVLTGGSIGWQIGVEAVDLVLLVMNKEGVDNLLEDRFTIGGNAAIAAGPVGRSAEASTNPSMNAGILAYSRSRGLFAGATLEGASLRADRDAMESFYGRPQTLRAVSALTSVPAEATDFARTLARLTGASAAAPAVP